MDKKETEEGREESKSNAGMKTYMICPNSINLLNLLIKRNTLINDQLQKFLWGGLSSQQLELAVNSASPCNNDPKGNLPEQIIRVQK